MAGPTELAVHVRELLGAGGTDADEPLAARPEAAARAIRDAAHRGDDLGPHLPVLRTALAEATSVGVTGPLAEALAVHLVRVQDVRGLGGLLALPYAADDLLRGVRAAAERGLDVRPFVDVIAAAPGRVDRLARRVLFTSLVGAGALALGEVLDRLERLAPVLVPEVVRDLATGGPGVDLGPALPALGRLLHHPDPDLRVEAAHAVRVAVEAGVPMEPLRPELESALHDGLDDVRSRAAYALGLGEMEGARERLLAHGDPVVRFGAVWALGMLLLARGRAEVDLVDALTAAVGDRDRRVRERAREVLLEARQRELALVPGEDAIARLLERAVEPRGGGEVADYLGVLAVSPDAGTRVRAALAATPLRGPVVDRLRAASERRHASTCSVCRHLPRTHGTSSSADLPRAFRRLLDTGVVLEDGAKLLRCPECERSYRYLHTVEQEDMSSWETHTLERIGPLGARRLLPPPLRADDEARGSRRVAEARRALDHLEEWVRRDASWTVAEQAVADGDVEPLRGLLHHPDVAVREEAVATLVRDGAALPAGALGPDVRALLEEPGGTARAWAAELLVTDAVRGARAEEVRALADHAEPEVSARALDAAARLAAQGSDLAWLAPSATARLEHADPRVRAAALVFLERCFRRSGPSPEVVAALVDGARRPGPGQEPAVRALAAAAENGADLTAALPVLAGLFLDAKAGWAALQAAHAAVRRGADATPLLSRLGEIVNDPRCPNPTHAYGLVQLAIGRGGDLSTLVPALARLAQADHCRETVTAWIHQAARQGADLSGAIDVLRQLAQASHDGYTRQEATYALVTHWTRRGEWIAVQDLVRHARPDVRGAACHRLEEMAGTADLGPLLPAVADTARSAEGYARSAALRALRRVAETGAEAARVVLGLLGPGPHAHGPTADLAARCHALAAAPTT